MKNFKFALIPVLLLTLYSCETGMSKWEDDTSRIQFINIRDTVLRKTFIFDTDKVVDDTLYLKVRTMGYTVNRDRYFKLKQIEIEGARNGASGIHYVGFDDPEMREYLKIKANEATAIIPIIVKRDPSLKKGSVEMKFIIDETDEFKFGEVDSITRKVVVSDDYERPSAYSAPLEKLAFLRYSKVKHEFMHKVLLEQTKYVPNEEFFFMVDTEDSHYYYSEMFGQALAKYNADPNNTNTPLTSEPLLPEFPEGEVIEFKW